MDDTKSQAGSRKRLKTQHPDNDLTMEEAPSKEAECGITEYISPELPGFVGVLKKRSAFPVPVIVVVLAHDRSRYTDFLVNEVLPSGVVVHLDDLRPPKLQKANPAKSAEPKPAGPLPVDTAADNEAPDAKAGPSQESEPQAEPTTKTSPEQISYPDENTPKPPHLRVHAPTKDLKDEGEVPQMAEQPSPDRRLKEKVYLRQTGDGLEVISKEKVEELKQQESARSVAHTTQPKDSELPELKEQTSLERDSEKHLQQWQDSAAPSEKLNQWHAYASVPQSIEVSHV